MFADPTSAAPRLVSLATATPKITLRQAEVTEQAARHFARNPAAFDWLAPIYRNAEIDTRHSCVEPDWYRAAVHQRSGAAVRLAWIGQRAVLPSLACASEQLAAASRALPGLALWLICDTVPEGLPLSVVLRPWSSASEADDLAESDIGISWLVDDLWSPGKCGLKVLQYMAAGLPVVANPVGIHRRLIADGVTGFLAETPAEWARAITRLAADPSLRTQMGAAARQRVIDEYSVGKWGPRLTTVLEAVARGDLAGSGVAQPGVARS